MSKKAMIFLFCLVVVAVLVSETQLLEYSPFFGDQRFDRYIPLVIVALLLRGRKNGN